MDFLKKHYEKVLLGLMLAGLIGVLVFMIFYITSDKADMDSKRITLINPPAKALTNLDLTLLDGVAAFTDGGPSNGELKAANVMIAGDDRVAVAAAARRPTWRTIPLARVVGSDGRTDIPDGHAELARPPP